MRRGQRRGMVMSVTSIWPAVSRKARAALALFGDGDFAIFRRLFSTYFPRYRNKYFIIGALILISSYATAMSAWLVRDVVNTIFVDKQGAYLIPIVVFVMVIFTVKGLSTYWQSQLGARIANDMVADAQRRLFTHFLKQRVAFFDVYSSDDLIMRVNQGASAFSSILNKVLLNGVRDAATVLALVVVMVAQDPQLTLICFGAVPLIFWAINYLLRQIKALMQQEMRTFADLNKNVREIVQGAKTIKSYNLQPLFYRQADTAIESIKTISNRISGLNNAPVPIIDTLGGIGIGLTILYAGYRTVYTAYDPGTFLSFITALLMAQDPARRLSQVRVSLKTALVGIDMVQRVLDDDQSEPEHGDFLPRSAMGLPIQFDNVEFGYEAGKNVLTGFNLDIAPGEMVALVGPSGAGKSTIFALLLRFYEQQRGAITIADKDIRGISINSLRQTVSYVGQSNFIFSGSIRDNLTLGQEGIEHEALVAACEAVGLHQHIQTMRNGYNSAVGELGSLISGGQAQRLNIARAIIKDSPVLLLDEVTSALDAENEELVRNYMHAQVGRKTILVIAHRLSTIRQADKIALMENGRVSAFGTHKELVKTSQYYEKIANLQLVSS